MTEGANLLTLGVGKYHVATNVAATILNSPVTTLNYSVTVSNRIGTLRRSIVLEDYLGNVYRNEEQGANSWSGWDRTVRSSEIPKAIRWGIAYSSDIIVGKTSIDVTFEKPMPNTDYIVLAMQNLNYIDVQVGLPSGGKRTDGFTMELWSTRASTLTALVGFGWIAVGLD